MDEEVRRADSMSPDAHGLDVWFARAQRGDPATLEGTLRAVFATARRLVPLDAAPETDRPDIASGAVERLVVAEREVLVLADLRAARTAQRLGIGVRATKSPLARARRSLAASISESQIWSSA